MRSRVNKHHLFYERSAYQRLTVLRNLREQPGLIIPMFITEHQALHRAVDRRTFGRPTVPLPNLEAAKYFVESVLLPYSPDQPRLQALQQAIGWFAMTNNEDTAEHLAKQRDFILKTTPFGDEGMYGQSEMDGRRPVVLTQREPFPTYPEISAA
jgi:hypothetical protein